MLWFRTPIVHRQKDTKGYKRIHFRREFGVSCTLPPEHNLGLRRPTGATVPARLLQLDLVAEGDAVADRDLLEAEQL